MGMRDPDFDSRQRAHMRGLQPPRSAAGAAVPCGAAYERGLGAGMWCHAARPRPPASLVATASRSRIEPRLHSRSAPPPAGPGSRKFFLVFSGWFLVGLFGVMPGDPSDAGTTGQPKVLGNSDVYRSIRSLMRSRSPIQSSGKRHLTSFQKALLAAYNMIL